MLEDHVDWKRVALCCKIGRRFWSICKSVRLYADVNFYYRYSNVTFKKNTLDNESESIELSGNMHRKLLKFRDLKELDNEEIFRFYDGDFYVNAVKFYSDYAFRSYYDDIGLDAMSDEFVNMLYYSTVDHVPLEINFINAHMRDSVGNVYGSKAFPMVYVLYKNDDVVNFFTKFTADLMFNPIHHVFLMRGGLSSRINNLTHNEIKKLKINSLPSLEDRIGMDCKNLLKSIMC